MARERAYLPSDNDQVDELWRLYIRGYVNDDPVAKAKHDDIRQLNRAQRRRMEARSRKLRKAS